MITSKSHYKMLRTGVVAGFSLVEIMVGMVIGMLSVIVVLQVFSVSEGQKRTTTGGGDAQSAGAIAMYQLQNDIGQAGYGVSSISLFNCNIKWALPSGTNIATAVPLAPVTINPAVNIVPAGDPNTDTILVMYGNTNGEPQGNTIIAPGATVNTVQMPSAFATGDKVISAPSACGSTQLAINSISAVGANSVTLATAGIANGAVLYNLGSAPVILAYAVRNGSLTVCDYLVNDCGSADTDDSSIWIPLAPNIVTLKAQYARDTDGTMDAVPNIYDGTTPSGSSASCGWARVSALRLALVARSNQYEKTNVTTAAPTWAGTNAGNPVGSASNPIDVSKNPDGTNNSLWQRYRYKLFETTVPIRNVAWMGVPQGC
jgi:type IV pilus assembly protein PilW